MLDFNNRGGIETSRFHFLDILALVHQGKVFVVLELAGQSYPYDASFMMDIVLLGALLEWGRAFILTRTVNDMIFRLIRILLMNIDKLHMLKMSLRPAQV